MDASVLANKLSQRSKELYYDVYTVFDWPDVLPHNEYWMSPELLSVYGTEYADSLNESQLVKLSQLETINMFSIFAYGESDLIQTILKNTLRSDLSEFNDYLSHFIDEENKHLWFFTEFCNKYDNGVIPVRNIPMISKFTIDIERLLSFIRIIVFEEIGDYYNYIVMNDVRITPFVREIHKRHHMDEVGHIAIGWKIAEKLLRDMRSVNSKEITAASNHMSNFMESSLQSFYNPDLYARININKPYDLRSNLLQHNARKEKHENILNRINIKLDKLWAGAN